MNKSQSAGVQGLSRELVKTIVHELFVFGEGGSPEDTVPAILRIIEDRM
jgi:hypothetical protein